MDNNAQNLYYRLGMIIHEKMKVEWMKGSMFDPRDVYSYFPSLRLRFYQSTCDADVKRIQTVLESYNGLNEWCIFKQPFSRTDIYVISVIQFRDYKLYLSQQSDFITARQYFGDDKYKELCNSIISDLESLCEWFADRICD